MTNTQSPAPGVAAEATIGHLMTLAFDYACNYDAFYGDTTIRASAARDALESALRTALQASAAAVGPDCYIHHDQLAYLRSRPTDDSDALVRYANGFPSWLPESVREQYVGLYTAPPLPAQVQEAELSDRDIEEMWNLHMTSKGQARGYADTVRDAFTRGRASRTPAPGMGRDDVLEEAAAFMERCNTLLPSTHECADAIRRLKGSAPPVPKIYAKSAPGMAGGVGADK